MNVICIYLRECCNERAGVVYEDVRESGNYYITQEGRKLCKECFEEVKD